MFRPSCSIIPKPEGPKFRPYIPHPIILPTRYINRFGGHVVLKEGGRTKSAMQDLGNIFPTWKPRSLMVVALGRLRDP